MFISKNKRICIINNVLKCNYVFRIDSELRKWIEPRNLKPLNDNLSMIYVEQNILSTNIKQSKHDNYIRNKNKKQDKLHKRSFK